MLLESAYLIYSKNSSCRLLCINALPISSSSSSSRLQAIPLFEAYWLGISILGMIRPMLVFQPATQRHHITMHLLHWWLRLVGTLELYTFKFSWSSGGGATVVSHCQSLSRVWTTAIAIYRGARIF